MNTNISMVNLTTTLHSYLPLANIYFRQQTGKECLTKENRYNPWMICEAIEIQKHPNFNKEDGWKLSNTWDPLIKSLKSQTHHTREQDSVNSFCRNPRRINKTLIIYHNSRTRNLIFIRETDSTLNIINMHIKTALKRSGKSNIIN